MTFSHLVSNNVYFIWVFFSFPPSCFHITNSITPAWLEDPTPAVAPSVRRSASAGRTWWSTWSMFTRIQTHQESQVIKNFPLLCMSNFQKCFFVYLFITAKFNSKKFKEYDKHPNLVIFGHMAIVWRLCESYEQLPILLGWNKCTPKLEIQWNSVITNSVITNTRSLRTIFSVQNGHFTT